jgi:MoaA/NifB/PqqE/SkfB family radical SAM enzyme
MQRAGCQMIDIGLETASLEVMKQIKKNASLEKVLEVVNNCYALKLPVNVNLMAGFPFETKEDIRTNIEFMKTISKKISRFNVGLVLRPYPGTEVYDLYHRRYGFSQWWLNERFTLSEDADYIPFYLNERLGAWTLPEDPILEHDFFHYSPGIKREIGRFVSYKCWFSLRKNHGVLKSITLLMLFYLSKHLYRLNPALEKAVMLPIFRLGQMINRLGTYVAKKTQDDTLATLAILKKYSRTFFRTLMRSISRPDKLFRHVINRTLFLLCIPLKGIAAWPLAFYINLNSRCNLRCKMCDVGQRQVETYIYKNMASKKELALHEWKTIINKIAFLRPHIDISAVEPFLYKDIVGLMEFVKKEKRLSFSLTTNGFFLERYVPDIIRFKVDSITVSIDGPPKLHDRIRGVNGVFDAAIRGMQALLSYKRRPLLGINYTISDYNYLYLEKTIEYLTRMIDWDYFTVIHLSFITKTMAKMQNGSFPDYSATDADISGVNIDKIDTSLLVQQMRMVKQRFRSKNLRFHPEMPLKKIHTYYSNPQTFILKKQCIMPWIAASILSNGDVIAFNRCPTSSFGNLLHSSFQDIWNCSDFRRFRMCLKKEGAFPVCSRCGSLKIK